MQSFSIHLRLGILFLSTAAIGWFFTRRKRWVAVGKLSHIYMYPLKSGKGRELPEAECTTLGLKYVVDDMKAPLRDRVFVVFDEEKKAFLSGKLNPKMIFVTVEPKTSKSVVFSCPEKPDIVVTLPDHFEDNCVTLWASEKVLTVDCGDEIAKWMSELIRGEPTGLRVGYWPESETWRRDVESLRPTEMTVFKKLSNQFTGAYSDLSSYLLLNSNSVDELNERIGSPNKCGILNFRPNLVIEGPQPFDEDKWDWVKIGDVVFRTFRPCTRCRFTTLDPGTGETNKDNEPIKTLKTYRTMEKLGESRVDAFYPAMGVYVGLLQGGTIRPGDTVYIPN